MLSWHYVLLSRWQWMGAGWRHLAGMVGAVSHLLSCSVQKGFFLSCLAIRCERTNCGVVCREDVTCFGLKGEVQVRYARHY